MNVTYLCPLIHSPVPASTSSQDDFAAPFLNRQVLPSLLDLGWSVSCPGRSGSKCKAADTCRVLPEGLSSADDLPALERAQKKFGKLV
jgi:hypothetical protein